MITNSKVIRIRYPTWNRLKRLVPPKQFEKLIDYIDRAIREVENGTSNRKTA